MYVKKKYIAVFVVSENESYSVLKQKRFIPSNDKIRFSKDNSHLIDVSKPTYSKGLKLLYFVDINKGQICFGDSNATIDPSLIDSVLKQGIVRQLTSSLFEKAWGTRVMDILLGLAVGGLIGFIAGGLI